MVTMVASITGLIYNVPIETIVAGNLATQAIIIWYIQVNKYADSLRNTQFDVLNSGGRVYAKLLEKYLRRTFSDMHILIGVGIFTGALAYLFNHTNILDDALGGINPILMIFVLILTLCHLEFQK